MTPLEVAQGMANFLKERLAEYEERGGKEFHVYAGFLPRARRVEELEKLCPAIVIRPEVTTDEAKQSTVSLVLYATVYDPDFKEGCQSLFHLLEIHSGPSLDGESSCRQVLDSAWNEKHCAR